MARCIYRYPDSARCLYDDHRLAEGEMCSAHVRESNYAQHLADNNARAKRNRALKKLTEDERGEQQKAG